MVNGVSIHFNWELQMPLKMVRHYGVIMVMIIFHIIITQR